MRDGEMDKPEFGSRYVWEIPAISFGPIFMQVTNAPGRAKAGHVYFRCIGPTGEPFQKLKGVRLPLPANMRAREWTDADVAEAGKRLRAEAAATATP
jgi:hypothetical protein